jgi:uncharacterized SAM-binding protein YcdF (DUF218 family)
MTSPQIQSANPKPEKPPGRFARAVGFMLDVYVVTLAVCSVGTWAFYLWIDLRFAGDFLMTALPALWAVSVLAAVALIRTGKHGGVIRALLWPTYMILMCAIGNAIYFYGLYANGRIDTGFPLLWNLPPLPMCVWIGFLLLAWAYLTRRRAAFPPTEKTPAKLRVKIMRVTWIMICTAFVAAAFWVNTYETPPRDKMDVAVVLGMRVNVDGTASVTLENRTLAAVRLYHEGVVDKIIVSGTPEYFPGGIVQSEALAMERVCLANGVKKSDIVIDPIGHNTRATIYNTRQIMRDRGWTSVVGVSNSSHLPRIRMSFRQAGMDCATVASRPVEWLQADVGETLREFAGLLTYAMAPNYRPATVEKMNVKNPRIVVTKSKKTLELFDGEAPVKTYSCVTGAADGDKEIEGDKKTPEGKFRVVFKNPKSDYHLSLGLNYPDAADAARGLAAKQITQEVHDMIVKYSKMDDLSDENIQKIYWKTPLGGEIFIHGESASKGGTAGCVKVTNEEIEELYAICRLGTPVEIRP